MLFPIGRSVYNGLQTSLRQNCTQPAARNPVPESAGFLRVLPLCFDGAGQRLHQLPHRQRESHQIHRAEWPGPHPSALLWRHDGSAGPLPHEPDLTLRQPAAVERDAAGQRTSRRPLPDRRHGRRHRRRHRSAPTAELGDLLPGTNVGGFGRSFGVNGLNQKITNFNNTMVGQATPAGQVLISNGLFTLAQLQPLGGVIGGQSTGGTARCRWLRRARLDRRG